MSEGLPLFRILPWRKQMVDIAANRVGCDALIVESPLVLEGPRSALGRVDGRLEDGSDLDTLTHGVPEVGSDCSGRWKRLRAVGMIAIGYDATHDGPRRWPKEHGAARSWLVTLRLLFGPVHRDCDPEAVS